MLDKEQLELKALEELFALEDRLEEVLEDGVHYQPKAMTFDQLKAQFPYGTHEWREVRTSRRGNCILLGSVKMIYPDIDFPETGSIEFTSIAAVISPDNRVFTYSVLHDEGWRW